MNTTKENNKLLAEFLGWETDTKDRYITPFGEMDESGYMRYDYEKNNLQFDCDWNWLMEVAEKIENQHNRTIQIERGVCYIHNGGIHHGRSTKVQTKIEAVYNACVEFVEWLNKEEYQKAVMNSIDLE